MSIADPQILSCPPPVKPVTAVVSVSGGKDSTATAILALERMAKKKCRFAFADTGNEHELTLEYISYLQDALGIEVQTLRSDFSAQIARKRVYVETVWPTEGVPDAFVQRTLAALVPTGVPFLDLCLWKGRFPSRKAQFCTQELKRRPLDNLMFDLSGDDADLESWQGVRRDESEARKDALERELTPEGWTIVRPIATWTVEDVFACLHTHGIKPNPLYLEGMRRVGCMPCINCAKDELLEISKRFPHHIDRIRSWEALCSEASKRGISTFFHSRETANMGLTDAEFFEANRIDRRIEWAKTSRGGKQFDMLRTAPTSGCSSSYGLCE